MMINAAATIRAYYVINDVNRRRAARARATLSP